MDFFSSLFIGWLGKSSIIFFHYGFMILGTIYVRFFFLNMSFNLLLMVSREILLWIIVPIFLRKILFQEFLLVLSFFPILLPALLSILLLHVRLILLIMSWVVLLIEATLIKLLIRPFLILAVKVVVLLLLAVMVHFIQSLFHQKLAGSSKCSIANIAFIVTVYDAAISQANWTQISWTAADKITVSILLAR